MSIRVYNLAKQLQKDNNVIIGVCNKLGIKSKNKNAKTGSEGGLVALSTLSDEDVERIKEYFANETPVKKPSFRNLMEADLAAPLEPPKPTHSTSGKMRRIQPARGRITEVDPNKRAVSAAIPVKETSKVDDSVPSEVSDVKPIEAPPVAETVETAVPVKVSVDETVQTSGKEEIDERNDRPSPAVLPEAEAEVKEETPVKDTVAVETKINEETPAPTEVVSDHKTEAVPTVSEPTVSEPTVSEPTVATAAETPSKEETAEKVEKKEQHPATPLRKAPLRQALDNRNGRDGQRRGREREKDKDRGIRDRDSRRNARQPDVHPMRPAPVASSFIAQLESRAQILDEMKRPPMITTQPNDRVRVLGASTPKPKSESSTSQSGSSARNNSPKTNLNLHLAPMPAEPVRPVKKAVKEPVAQKPEKRLPPEALRAAASGNLGPLARKLRAQKEGGPSGPLTGTLGRKSGGRSTQDGGVSGDRFQRSGFSPRGGDSGFGATQGGSSEFGNGRRSKKGGKDRDEVEGREDVRGASRRRQGNESRRLRNGEDESFDFRYSTRSGGRSARRDKSSSSGGSTMPRKNDVVIETPCSARQFAETTGLSVPVVIKKLMELGYMLNVNQPLETETLELLIVAFELKATIKQEATLEELYVDTAYDFVDPPETLVPRAPVVTFLGHVDHGKTSLLDSILHLHVVQGEKGGITQHIRAYRVETPGGPVTFVDTPGHEAFTEMRARGANVTDVAVLVVAADDGVMPQTEEAISHAKAAGVPIVVALNKMDLPGVNRDKVIQELASNDLMPSEWGGDVEIVETSAVTGMGVDTLLETLLMVAELHELKANPNRAAMGVVLEASLKSGEGVVCTALVQKGTLRPGDVVLCGSSYGRVRSMNDTLNKQKRIKEAGPGVPVSMTGLDVAPDAGSRFVVLDDVAVARQIAEERAKRAHEVELAGAPSHVTLESLFERINSAKTQQTLNVIIRADVRGSIEAIRKELGKLEHPEVKVKILQASVGGVTEADVHLADASDAVIVGFNVVPDEGARALAEAKKVQIRRYDVIYKLTEDIRAALEGMLKPVEQVKELGRALVQRTFNISHVGVIAGCRVLYGMIERDCQIRVIRDSRIIGEYKLETLKREKDDAKEVREGYECGMKLKNYNDVKEGDVLEAYKIEEVARTF